MDRARPTLPQLGRVVLVPDLPERILERRLPRLALVDRPAITIIAVALPRLGVLVLLDSASRRQAAEEELAELIFAQLEAPFARERCEAAPTAWRFARPLPAREGDRPPPGAPPPGPPMRPRGRGTPARAHSRPASFFVCDQGLRPQSVDAPAAAPGVAEAVRTSELVGSLSRWDSSDIEIFLRTPWGTGPCAFVLARGTTEPWLGGLLPPTRIWLAPVMVLFIAVLVAIGPVIGRIRRLTEAVQRSAASGYEGEVALGGRDELAALARAFDADEPTLHLGAVELNAIAGRVMARTPQQGGRARRGHPGAERRRSLSRARPRRWAGHPRGGAVAARGGWVSRRGGAHAGARGKGAGPAHRLSVAELHGLSLVFQASEYGGLQVDLEGALMRPGGEVGSP